MSLNVSRKIRAPPQGAFVFGSVGSKYHCSPWNVVQQPAKLRLGGCMRRFVQAIASSAELPENWSASRAGFQVRTTPGMRSVAISI